MDRIRFEVIINRNLYDWMSATGLFCFSNFLEFFYYCSVRL